MIILLKLNRVAWKLTLLLPVLVMGVWLLSQVRDHFLIRQLSDTRYTYETATLLGAFSQLPHSARISHELANALIQEKLDFVGALPVAENATRQSPMDTANWLVLGRSQDGIGQLEDAERSFKRAIAVAPLNSDANWALANLLIRKGDIAESLRFFEKASRMNASLYPMAFDLLGRITGNDLATLHSIADAQFEGQMALVHYLAEEGLVEAASTLFGSIDRNKAKQHAVTTEFINLLIRQKKTELAQRTWFQVVRNTLVPEAELLWNGSFELDLVRPLSQFDWILSDNQFARLRIEPGRGRNGTNALQITFLGKDTTKINGEFFQLLALKPGTRYRLEGFAKGLNLVSSEGPKLAIRLASAILTTTQPVELGTSDWQRLTIDFTAPSDTYGMSVGVIRVPQYAYDEPTTGVVLFDDITLRAL